MSLLDGSTREFTLDELKQLEKKNITATIQCAGNRRSEMNKVHINTEIKQNDNHLPVPTVDPKVNNT